MLALALRAKPSETVVRAETLPFNVLPKSEKFSKRPATPKVHAPSGSRISRSP